jgi:transcriptional regulator
MGELPVLKGTLDLLVLKAVSDGAKHGFEITQWIEERSGGSLEFDDSGVYQAVYRLEKKGMVGADWGVTENNRRARYYEITRRGEDHLRAETDQLLRLQDVMAAILTSRPSGA